jgi:tetratricopeptide (TPR) repeat protein
VKAGAGAGGYNDRAIDIRVDDNPDPFRELGRLLKLAETNYLWNTGWTAFERKQFPAALEAQERAALLAPDNAELLYDLAVIRLANGHRTEAVAALHKALTFNPKLKQQAAKDNDLTALRSDLAFQELVR